MSFPGIAIPELLVQQLAQQTIDRLASPSGPTFLATLLRNNASADLDSFLTAFRNRPGKARLDYAHEAPEDWQVVVLMTGTAPSKRTIGDEMGEDDTEIGATSLSGDIPAGPGVALPLVALPADLPASGRVWLDGAELALYTRSGSVVTLLHRGVGGTVATPHAADGTVLFTQVEAHPGWDEYCQVQCHVVSSNSLFNVVLATVLKASLLAARDDFDGLGLGLRYIGENAMAPRPIAIPASRYSRPLILDVHRAFSVPQAIESITDVQVDVDVEQEPIHATPEF